MINKNLHDQYDIVPDPTKNEQDHWCIKLKKGLFAGVIIRFGRVKLVRENSNENAKGVVYEYDLVYLPERLRDKKISKRENKKIHALLGDIVLEILEEGYSENEKMKHCNDKFIQTL